jgi:hypothetical protein
MTMDQPQDRSCRHPSVSSTVTCPKDSTPVEIVASSLFDAAALALARFRGIGLSESAFGPAAR